MKHRVRLICHVDQINPVPRAYACVVTALLLQGVRYIHLRAYALGFLWYGAKTHVL